jgi:hypothetical protein
MKNQPDYTASISNAVQASLAERQKSVDQARAVAVLLLDGFNAMTGGEDGPEDHHVIAALQVIVDRLGTCYDLTDSVSLENGGRNGRAAVLHG